MIKQFLYSILVATVATGFSYLLAFQQGWITSIDWLEFAATYASFACTFLFVLQTRLAYYVGFVSVTLLAALFYKSNLYGSAALQGYLVFQLIYGWFRWGKDTNTLPVSFLVKDKNAIGLIFGYAGITAVAYLGAVYVQNYFGAKSVGLDAALLVLSILAQFLLDNKRIENWIVWIVVNIISVYVYVNNDLYIVAIQMGLFGLNALWGMYMWKKSMDKNMQQSFLHA